MKHYEFALRFALPPGVEHSDELIERLGDAGCDDALIGVGHAGRIALEFDRGADSARDAILGAIGQVAGAIPGAELVEASPDLVGVTDVARLVGCSRQNIRKLMVAASSGAPAPLHEGSASLWHLAPVLRWLAQEKRYAIDDDLLELSEAAMMVNAAVDALRADPSTRDAVRTLLA
jgi:hypothetical protein